MYKHILICVLVMFATTVLAQCNCSGSLSSASFGETGNASLTLDKNQLMKTKTIIRAILIPVFTISFYSCAKEDLGGDATLVVFLQHHGHTIINHVNYPDTVFVKFNTKESPGTAAGKYDTYFVGEAGEDHVHCENLKWGNYFIYGAGIDSSGPYRVNGGIAVKIKRSDRKKEQDIDLAVTE